MTTFDNRERAFESKFAHDAEMRFKAEARRNRLLGEWAAGLLGKEGDDARAYAQSVVAADFSKPGEEDVYQKLATDLEGKAGESEIRTKMAELTTTAQGQILDETT